MLKKTAICFVATTGLLAGTAWAQQASPQDQCQQARGFAEQVMTKRQDGTSQKEQVKELTSAGQLNKQQQDALTQLVAAAYEEPQHDSDEDKQDAIKSFGEQAYKGCSREMKQAQ